MFVNSQNSIQQNMEEIVFGEKIFQIQQPELTYLEPNSVEMPAIET